MAPIEQPPVPPLNTEAIRAPETYLVRDWGSENFIHIYPRTFNEARREGEEHLGIGSIKGITEKLDWVKDSGVTAIWLGPIYESPGLDGGYDIANYREIDNELGSVEDVDEMICEAHQRDIRVVFDLVPNHTSDKSKWFEASSDPNHPEFEKFRDFYIWRDPVKGKMPANTAADERLKGFSNNERWTGYTVPNNWTSIFSTAEIDKVKERNGGEIPENVAIPAVTAWTWCEARQQFYLAEFLKEQPSLDHGNPEVRESIKDVERFWLDKGVDGFRIDVINHIGKDPALADEEPAPIGSKLGEYNPGTTNPHDQLMQAKLVSHPPEYEAYAKDLLSVADEYPERNVRFILEDWMSALDNDPAPNKFRPDVATVFNFIVLLNTNREHWNAESFKAVVEDYYDYIGSLEGATPNQVSGNHDVDTLRTRLGSKDTMRAAYALLAFLPGSLYTWQGDFLGRPNASMPKQLQKDAEIGQRDGERVPMQWDDSKNSGFSEANPGSLWLPMVDSKFYQADNLELQTRDPKSPYRLIKSILRMRSSDPALRNKDLSFLHTDNPDVLALSRSDPDNSRRQLLCLTNFSANTTEVRVPNAGQSTGRIILTSRSGQASREINLDGTITLPPDTTYYIESAA